MEREHAGKVATEAAHTSKHHMYTSTLLIFWPRLLATCLTWAANGEASTVADSGTAAALLSWLQ